MDAYVFREKKILIYGAGSLGITCNNILRRAGLQATAYIDKRADTLKEYEGYKVYAVNELSDWKDKDKYCIIIAIRNVFDHSQLALQFYQLGFRALIFKPTMVLKGKKSPIFDNISSAHDSLMIKFEVPDMSIMYYEKEKIFEAGYDLSLACSKEGFYKVHISSELLFSNVIPRYLWTERNFVSNYVGVELYKAFQGTGDLSSVIEKYVQRFALPGAIDMKVDVSGAWEDILIDSRLAVYNEMCDKMAIMPEFFVENCTTVSLRENGGFKLIASGKNRVSFLIARGYRFIPVMISKQDYEQAEQVEYVRKIENYLETAGINELDVPIPHFYFYEFRYLIPQYTEQWQSTVGYYLAEQVYELSHNYDFSKYCIVDYSTDHGSMSRFLSMLGFAVERRVTGDELTDLVDGLLRVSVTDGDKAEKLAYVISDLEGNMMIAEEDVLACPYCLLLEYDNKPKSLYSELVLKYTREKEILHTFWKGRYVTGRFLSKEEI